MHAEYAHDGHGFTEDVQRRLDEGEPGGVIATEHAHTTIADGQVGRVE